MEESREGRRRVKKKEGRCNEESQEDISGETRTIRGRKDG